MGAQAGRRAAVLAGDNVTEKTVSQITELGLASRMVTDYTSYVAVVGTRVVTASGASKMRSAPR